ncbi:MAG: hypothetical protein AB7E49_02215 [Campylobacterales bacterium]
MLRILLLIILFFGAAQGANLNDAKVQSGEKTVDLMLSLDKPFEGKVVERHEENQLFVLIEGVTADSPRIFTPQSALLSSLRIHPDEKGILVHVSPKTLLGVVTETTAGGYGLRLRLSAQTPRSAQERTLLQNLGADRPDFTEKYLFAGLFIAALLLLWILVKLFGGANGESSWLMGKTKADTIQIIQQKALDAKNRIVLIRFKGMNYLLLLGQSNLLIDHYEDGRAPHANAFDELLKGNGSKLSDYLLEGTPTKPRKG